MRIIAGKWRGRTIEAPPGQATRPTADRVRETLFSMLASRLGSFDELRVADLFAGSGALGIEALSRGAARAVFIESDRAAARVINDNLAALGLEGVGTVRVADVVTWVESSTDAPYDLILVDPPYGFDDWERLLAALVTFPVELVVAESDRPIEAEGWDALSVKRHGGTVVSQLSPRGAR